MRTIGGWYREKDEEKLLAGKVNSSVVALLAQGVRMGDEVVLPSGNVITWGGLLIPRHPNYDLLGQLLRWLTVGTWR